MEKQIELDEAIKHAEETALTRDDLCAECRAEHKQLADWLKELKQYRKADVVPRSELDEFIQEIDQIQKDKAEVTYLKEQLIAKAKQEVASKLIDEISEFIWGSRGESFCLLVDGTFYGREEMKEFLRKKYIGEKK